MKTVTKAQVNKILKEQFGLANVKMKKDYSGFSHVTVKQYGKMVKGCALGSKSPMDCTMVGHNAREATVDNIKRALRDQLGLVADEYGRMTMSENSKSFTYLYLSVEDFPTYARSMNLDPSYKTSYIVPSFNKSEK